MDIVSPKALTVYISSITGGHVASFHSNTESGANLIVECIEKKNGGLDSFFFSTTLKETEPLFIDMECKIIVDGIHWFTGFADSIPERDNEDPVINITGKGFVHKLYGKTINKSYTSQTLDYIIKDIANTELGFNLNVYYNVSKINVPDISDIIIEFKDKNLYEVFDTLISIANKDFKITQYTWGVDKDKDLYFSPISNDMQGHFFEGYDYQNPKVENIPDKIVNSILAYRTTLADPKVTEYVGSYSHISSQGLYGLSERKITFPDYIDNTTISNIANGILEKYASPQSRIEIKNLKITHYQPIGFYGLSNRRAKYFLTVSGLEGLEDWDISPLINTEASISSEQVFTGRKALKLVTTVNSYGDYMEMVLDKPIRFPDIFRVFVYFADANGKVTIRLFDTGNNSVDVVFDHTDGTYADWIKKSNPVSVLLVTDDMIVDYDISINGEFIVDYDVSNSGELTVDNLEREGIINLSKVQIIIDNDNASTIYIDFMSVEANSYMNRVLMLEEIKYTLEKSYTASPVFGETVDSIIDEIKEKTKSGDVALSVFSKH